MINFIKNILLRYKLKNIKEKLEKINSIEDINAGGCAIVSLALKKYLNTKDAKIIYLMTSSDIDIGRDVNIKNGIKDSCAHSVMKIGSKYIDSTGIFTKEELLLEWDNILEEIEVELSMELSLEAINKVSWNPLFDRADNIAIIDDIFGLNNFLSKNVLVR